VRKVWSTVAEAIERCSGASSLTRRVTGSDGLWPSVASASNPHREGGSVSTRPSVLFHSRHDRQFRSCERFGRRWLMPLSVVLVLPRLRVGLLVPMAFGHRWRLLVTPTVREGASVHGPASYSTLDMIGNYDRANDLVDGG
jgi:hypothetical protein